MTYGQIQRLYSNAFDDGFEFFVQKEFGLGGWIKKKLGIVTEKDLEDVKNKAEEEKKAIEERARGVVRTKQERYNNLYGEYLDEKSAHNKTKEESAKALEESSKQAKALEEATKRANELEEAAKRAGEKEKGFEKSLRKWKIGAGVTAGVAGLGGLGAYLYNRKKNKD